MFWPNDCQSFFPVLSVSVIPPATLLSSVWNPSFHTSSTNHTLLESAKSPDSICAERLRIRITAAAVDAVLARAWGYGSKRIFLDILYWNAKYCTHLCLYLNLLFCLFVNRWKESRIVKLICMNDHNVKLSVMVLNMWRFCNVENKVLHPISIFFVFLFVCW